MRLNNYLTTSLLYLLALMQGITFVVVPAASIILTSTDHQNLTPGEYGSLFIPMIIGAVFISGAGGLFAKKFSLRKLLVPGILFNALSMAGLAGTEGTTGMHAITYYMLLLTMLFLGSGFGATLTSLNALIIQQFPNKSATALTSLHALLGIGTAIAPKMINLFNEIDKWWLAPFSVAVILTSLLFIVILTTNVGSKVEKESDERTSKQTDKPKLLWIFLLTTFLYGICETVIGNWSPIYLNKVKGLSELLANDGLSMFWALVTVGRIFTAIMSSWISFRWFYLTLPPLVVLTFFFLPNIMETDEIILMLGVAGLACSALLPLNISFGEQAFPHSREVVSGSLMSSYMTGYGIAAYGVGSLQSHGYLPLSMIFYFALIPAILMTFFSYAAHFLFPRSEIETPST